MNRASILTDLSEWQAPRRTLVAGVVRVGVLAGCGVQSGSEVDSAECASIKSYTLIKQDVDALDREMVDLRPATITLESLKSLTRRYRDAADEYNSLLQQAGRELERSRSERSELAAVWALMNESLTIRRDGFRFFAEAFANSESLKDPSVQAESQSWLRRGNEINTRLEESSTEFLRDSGFEQRDDGQFVIDC